VIKRELLDAIAMTDTMLDGLLATLHGKSGIVGAQLNYLCGHLRADGAAELNAGGLTFWIDYVACYEAARKAGATFEKMEALHTTALALAPTTLPGIAMKNFSIRLVLAQQARILAATDFTSRQDIDRYFDLINSSFELAELVAADNLDNVAYLALLAIHAALRKRDGGAVVGEGTPTRWRLKEAAN
jgi:hypothetical protein